MSFFINPFHKFILNNHTIKIRNITFLIKALSIIEITVDKAFLCGYISGDDIFYN